MSELKILLARHLKAETSEEQVIIEEEIEKMVKNIQPTGESIRWAPKTLPPARTMRILVETDNNGEIISAQFTLEPVYGEPTKKIGILYLDTGIVDRFADAKIIRWCPMPQPPEATK